jgi:hypothetical protein
VLTDAFFPPISAAEAEESEETSAPVPVNVQPGSLTAELEENAAEVPGTDLAVLDFDQGRCLFAIFS